MPAAAPPADPVAALERIPRLLVTGPPGSGKSHVLRALLDRAVRAHGAVAAHGAEGALLVLPTYGEAEHAKRTALSRREAVRGLLDAPYATFTSLGERLLDDFRVGDLPTRAERDLWAAEAIRQAAVPAFAAVAGRVGFRSRFLRLVKEMKQTGEAAAVLRARIAGGMAALDPAPRERLAGFLAAWERYEALLAKAGRRDHEDALRDLLLAIRASPPAGLATLRFLALDGFEDLTGLEMDLLLAVADAVTANGGHVAVALPFDPAREALFSTVVPLLARLEAAGFTTRRVEGFARSTSPPLARLASALFGPGGDPACEPGEALGTIVASDPTDEVERIAREIRRLRDRKQGGIEFRDALVVFRRLDGIAPLARRVFASFGIPTRIVGAGERLSASAPVRALRGPMRLLAGDDGTEERPFAPDLLLDYFRWRAAASGSPLPAASVDATDIAWREKGFPADFRSLVDRLPRAAHALVADLDDVVRAMAAARSAKGPKAVWEVLLAAAERWLPLPGPGGFTADGKPSDPDGDERLRRAANAKARFLALGEGLRDAAVSTDLLPDLTARQAVEQWFDAAREAVAEPPDRRLDAVSLVDAEEARHWEADVVFVAGLVEGAFPLHPREDVFLRDEDRERLVAGRERETGKPAGGGSVPALRTSRQGEERERRLFLFAATRARSRLYLSRHATGEDGRLEAPSFFWRDANAALSLSENDPRRLGRDASDLSRACVPPAQAVREEDLRLHVASRLGALAAEFPEEERRLAVALARTGGPAVRSLLARAARFRRATADAVGPDARPRFEAAAAPLSPTQATMALACPYRFFLARVAKVPEDMAAFSGPSLDARLLGEVAHAALKIAVERPEAPVEEVVKAVLEEKNDSIPDAAARDSLAADVTRIVALFRDRERARAGAGFATDAASLEVAFGRTSDPVEVAAPSGALALSGRIDRVDRGRAEGRAAAIVVDYKLGATSARNGSEATAAGDDLQLALYARVVEETTRTRVVALEHYAMTRRERYVVTEARVEAVALARAEGGKVVALPHEEFRALLDAAVEKAAGVGGGGRAAGPDALEKRPREPAECGVCAYPAVCRPPRTFPRAPEGRR